MRASMILPASFLFAAALGCGSDEPGGPAMCAGAGCAACTDAVCLCSGGGRCETVCSSGCTLTCSGTEGCAGECGNDCTATCSGTDECNFVVGASSQIVCSGTHGCTVECVGGGCTAACSGTDGCAMSCPDGGCTIECEPGEVQDCGGGRLVCGRACG